MSQGNHEAGVFPYAGFRWVGRTEKVRPNTTKVSPLLEVVAKRGVNTLQVRDT